MNKSKNNENHVARTSIITIKDGDMSSPNYQLAGSDAPPTARVHHRSLF